MSDRKIHEFPVLTTAQASDDSKLMAMGLASTGALFSATIAQLKAVFGTLDLIYTATGAEGTALTLGALAGKKILSIIREGTGMYEVVSAPDSVSYVWDTATITFGLALGAGERLRINYRYL